MARGPTSKGLGTFLVFLPHCPDEEKEVLLRENKNLLAGPRHSLSVLKAMAVGLTRDLLGKP